MRLDAVGFCGVDDSVDLGELAALSAAHPWIEWGVLLRPDLQGRPRYAGQEVLDALGRLAGAGGRGGGGGGGAGPPEQPEDRGEAPKRPRRGGSGAAPAVGAGFRVAAHLCGEACLRALRGDAEYVLELQRAIGFRRVQLNPTGANAAGGWEPRAAAAGIRRLAAALPDTELILQVNDETRELFRLLFEGCGEGDIRPSNLAALLDASCGRGVAPEVQSLPVAGAHCGYAGGMGPETIDRQLREIAVVLEGHPDTVWIDMESGVRTRGADGSDVFDLAKVRQVIDAIVAAGLAPS